MNRPKAFVVYMFLLLVLSFNTNVYAEVCNRIVAVVNDDVITLYELNEKIERLTGQKIADLQNQDDETYIQARREILDLLIDEKVIQAKVKESGYETTASELETTIENIKKANHWTQEDLIAALQSKGLSFDEFKRTIKTDLDKNRFVDLEIKSKIVISDDAVKKYYNEHADQYKKYDQVRLAIISIPNDTSSAQEMIDNILARLNKGEDFSELAKQYSRGPNAAGGGDLGRIKSSQLDPKLKKMVENMSEGEVTQPIINRSGIQLIKVVEKDEKGVKTIEEVKGDIHDMLYKEEFEKRFNKWMKELRKKSYVRIIF